MKDLIGKLVIFKSGNLILIIDEYDYSEIGYISCNVINLLHNYHTVYYKSTIDEQGRILDCKLLELLYSS